MDIEYLKSINYICIDYTTKIKNKEDLSNLLIRCFNPKYNNIIFYIHLNKFQKQLRKEIKNSIGCFSENKNICLYFNKDNYVYYDINYIIPINKINEFLNMNDEFYNCDVCFKNLSNINGCHKCDFKICNDCIIKSIRIKDKTEGDKIVNCLICGFNNGVLTVN
jgi:hypothetical protein